MYFGRRYYDPETCRWVSPDPLGFQAGPNLYAYVMNNPLIHIDLYGLSAFYGKEGMNPGAWLGRTLQFIGDHLIPIPFARDFIARFGGVLSQQPRYEEGSSENLIVGTHRFNEKHIMTAVNGIWTMLTEFKSTIASMSCTLDGASIYGSYNGSHGFIFDIFECIAQVLNIPTNSVDKLAENLREACRLAGPDGFVDHFAHSQGGLITYRALQQLTAAERSQINVYTFGTAYYIDERKLGLASAVNYVSLNDPVGLFFPFLTNPVNAFRAVFFSDNCVKYLKSDTWPMMDHCLTEDGTYHNQFKIIARDIIKNQG